MFERGVPCRRAASDGVSEFVVEGLAQLINLRDHKLDKVDQLLCCSGVVRLVKQEL